ncbi:hypothetical protein JW868_01720 [Candidatus Woesearchaeota archaeon]|nr:hypothetical protein [Candidatus Woesearchaeota archaeon]
MILEELQLKNCKYRSRHGLSERLVRRHFQKKGYEVFRGSILLDKENSVNYYKWQSLQEKYDQMESVLKRHLGDDFARIQNFVRSWAGVPDYFVHRPAINGGDMFFVEVKMGQEQIRPNQYKCMCLLEEVGLPVVVVRLKQRLFRVKTQVQLVTDSDKGGVRLCKVVQSRQCRLTQKYVRKPRKSR